MEYGQILFAVFSMCVVIASLVFNVLALINVNKTLVKLSATHDFEEMENQEIETELAIADSTNVKEFISDVYEEIDFYELLLVGHTVEIYKFDHATHFDLRKSRRIAESLPDMCRARLDYLYRLRDTFNNKYPHLKVKR